MLITYLILGKSTVSHFFANFFRSIQLQLTFSVRTIGGTTVQVGVVSFGSSVCGDGSGPSGNARIEWPGIRDWIRTNTGI